MIFSCKNKTMRSQYYIQYFPSIHQMQAKQCESSLIEKTLVLTYRYMDYWIPVCVFITFPVWILPSLLYYISCSFLHTCKSIMNITKTIIYSKPATSELSYAILRGNGRYLREEGEDVHKKQFYDYTSRRFMSIGDFETETKIIELECQSEVGLNFFAQSIISGTVVGVHSNKQAIKSMQRVFGMVSETDYSLAGQPVGYDCMLLFDFKNKVKYGSNEGKVDLLKILAYCKHHMHPSGHLVFGDYFQDGEIDTFIDLFKAFRLKVVDQEDITKNIEYAKKLQEKNKRCEQRWIETALCKLNEWKEQNIKRKFIVIIAEKDS